MKRYVMTFSGYLPTLVFSPEQGFNRVLKGRGTVVATGRVEQGMIKFLRTKALTTLVRDHSIDMGLLLVSFFSDEEETTSRPKADALFIPRENLSALVIRPLETWHGIRNGDYDGKCLTMPMKLKPNEETWFVFDTCRHLKEKKSYLVCTAVGCLEPGDGVATIKRRRHDIHGDGVRDSAMASRRGRLKVDLEPSTWRRHQEYKATLS
ncbi:hypothetical protein Tco_1346333 [Tanacetum coccineum]